MTRRDDADGSLTTDRRRGLTGTDATAASGPGVGRGAGDEALGTAGRDAASGAAELDAEAARGGGQVSPGATAPAGSAGGSAGTPGYGTGGEEGLGASGAPAHAGTTPEGGAPADGPRTPASDGRSRGRADRTLADGEDELGHENG